MFYFIVTLLTLIALAFIIVPLRKSSKISSPDQDQLNIEIYKAKIKELENDLAGGQIDESELEQAQKELKLELLSEVSDDDTSTQEMSAPGWASVSAIILTPVLAVILYAILGSPGAATGTVPVASNDHNNAGSIEEMVKRLAQRMEQNPEKGEGWVMLGRSYTMLGKHQEAQQAYERALKILGENADVLALYAESLIMQSNDQFPITARVLLERALKADADHPRALWHAGMAAFKDQDHNTARAHWEKLLKVLPPNHESAGMVRQYLVQAGGTAPKAASAGKNVKVTVNLDEKLTTQLKPGDTLFVFARAANGPRMPIAISRTQPSAFPVTVTLSDADALMPGRTLSQVKNVVVGARISRQGLAQAQPGDLEAALVPLTMNANKTAQLLINKVVGQ